ncbi:MAG: CPBP family intramembrane glutamic endopeptidase [Promethearchaeota archaeon]
MSALLFLVRIFLVVFKIYIGTVPFLIFNSWFYIILCAFGLSASFYYTKYIEKASFSSIGYNFQIKDFKKAVILLISAFIVLILIGLVALNIVGIVLNLSIYPDKVIVALFFGLLLGGIYEEIMFRCFMQNYFQNITDAKKTIIYTALIFTLTHIGYLPFAGFGIFYLFLFVMALFLSALRYFGNQLFCFILHGGIVFILVIFM